MQGINNPSPIFAHRSHQKDIKTAKIRKVRYHIYTKFDLAASRKIKEKNKKFRKIGPKNLFRAGLRRIIIIISKIAGRYKPATVRPLVLRP